MDIAAVTMVKDEVELLQIWLKSYEAVCGRSNLFVFVHGHSVEIENLASGCNLIHVPRKSVGPSFNSLRWAMISSFINMLHESYDAVITGDVDEICFSDPNYGSLRDIIIGNASKSPVLNVFCLDVFEGKLEKDIDLLQPVLSQRSLALANGSYCKPLISYSGLNYAQGAHCCNHMPYLADGLYMAHLKYASRRISKKVSEMKTKTKDENGGDDAFRSAVHTSWIRGYPYIDRVIRRANKRDPQDLDLCLDALRLELKSNMAPHKRSKMMAFLPFKESELVLRMPERFREQF